MPGSYMQYICCRPDWYTFNRAGVVILQSILIAEKSRDSTRKCNKSKSEGDCFF